LARASGGQRLPSVGARPNLVVSIHDCHDRLNLSFLDRFLGFVPEMGLGPFCHFFFFSVAGGWREIVVGDRTAFRAQRPGVIRLVSEMVLP
jgi:hypothetical protein